MQSRAMSAFEVTTSVVVGFIVALSAQVCVFPLFGVHLSFGENSVISALFTALSIARSYALRRLFEFIRVRQQGQIA